MVSAKENAAGLEITKYSQLPQLNDYLMPGLEEQRQILQFGPTTFQPTHIID